MKTLNTLIRLAKFEVDERRRAMKVLLEREDEILRAIAELDDHVRIEAEAARNEPDFATSYGTFLRRARSERASLLEKLEELRPAIEAARDALAEAFEELKKVEITRDNRKEEIKREEERREQIELDEVGLQSHRREKGEDPQ